MSNETFLAAVAVGLFYIAWGAAKVWFVIVATRWFNRNLMPKLRRRLYHVSD